MAGEKHWRQRLPCFVVGFATDGCILVAPLDDPERTPIGAGGSAASSGGSAGDPNLGSGGILTSGGSANTGGNASGGISGTGGSGGASSGGASSGGASSGGASSGGASSGGTGGNYDSFPMTCSGGVSHSQPLIDDLADGDNAIAAPRRGWWWSFNDGGNTTQLPKPDRTGVVAFGPTPMGADFAACTTGTLGVAVDYPYAGIGFALNGSSAGDCTYDASNFTGIRFRVKGTMNVRLRLLTPATQPVSEGGTCLGECSDDFGFTVVATSDWAEYTIPFTMTAQEGWGMPAGPSVDVSELLRIQFQTAGGVAGTPFDFCVDDIRFY